MVVEENRPLGDMVRRDYEPCSWRVRSRFSESLERNRFPLGIYRSKLEQRKVEEDCMRVGPKEGVYFGGDDGRVMCVCVWRTRCGGGWDGCPRYHPRVGVGLLVLVVVDDIGSLISIIQRSPARKGIISRDGQSGRVQEGSRHPRVPGRTSGTGVWGGPGIFIEDPGAPDGGVGSRRIREVDGGYVR